MGYELELLKKLIDDELIDINAILIKNYKKLNINEKDIIVLSVLARQEGKGYKSFNPSRIKTKSCLSGPDLSDSLESLEKKGYLRIDVETNSETGKTGEIFNLDKLYDAIIEIYLKDIKQKEIKRSESFFDSISSFYEETYLRQMSPVEADIISRWNDEKYFTIDEIKSVMLDSIKLGKTSLKYVDQVLIKNKRQKEESPEYKEASKIIEELKAKWKK